MSETPRLRAVVAGEMTGTFILVFFGVGSVQAAVATGAQVGLWQVAAVWAIGVSLAIYASAALSGAHLNPAITLVAAVYDRLSWRRVAVYWSAQLVGAFLAALVLWSLFAPAIAAFEAAEGIVRGEPGSERSAMMFGEYFPNPAIFGTGPAAHAIVDLPRGMAVEAVGTAMLAFMVGALTSHQNMARPPAAFAAVTIGLTVAAIISLLAPLSQAGLNPARDFGPRLLAWMLGWGDIAIPGPQGGWFWVYIAGPLVGGLAGGGLQRLIARMH